MRIALWNPELAVVGRAEFDSGVAPKGWRVPVDVYRHIVDGPGRDLDQFALRMSALKMQAAQHTLVRMRDIVLHKRLCDAGFVAVAPRAPGFQQETALIAEHTRLDDAHPGQLGFSDQYGQASSL